MLAARRRFWITIEDFVGVGGSGNTGRFRAPPRAHTAGPADRGSPQNVVEHCTQAAARSQAHSSAWCTARSTPSVPRPRNPPPSRLLPPWLRRRRRRRPHRVLTSSQSRRSKWTTLALVQPRAAARRPAPRGARFPLPARSLAPPTLPQPAHMLCVSLQSADQCLGAFGVNREQLRTKPLHSDLDC